MPRNIKGPTSPELLTDMCSLLSAMLYCMTCPDCDGSGRMLTGNRRDRRDGAHGGADARSIASERCECRDEAQRLLAEMSEDGEPDDDDERDDAI